MSCKKVELEDFCGKKGMIHVCPMDVCMRNLWRKAERERSPVVSLLPGYRERLASRNPHVLCQKYGGACVCVCVSDLDLQ
jgi:hypothetical protein